MSQAQDPPRRPDRRYPWLGLLLVASGLPLIALRARFAFEPSDLPPRVFELGLGFGPHWRVEQGDLNAWLDGLAWLRGGWFVLALAAGPVLARALALRLELGRAGARVLGLGLVLTLALVDPVGLTAFVAERGFAGAPHYLEVEDLAGGLGLAAIALGLLAFTGAGRPSTDDPGGARNAWSLLLACAVAGLVPTVFAASMQPAGWGSTPRSAEPWQPLTNDGRAYALQAELFASGRLAIDAGDQAEAFNARQVLRSGTRFASKYPPGHSLLLTPGAWIAQHSDLARQAGGARLLPALLQAVMPLLVFGLARRLGARRPLLAAWLFALSPTPLVLGALWLSHGTSLPFATLAMLGALAALDADAVGRRRRALLWAAATGAALSVCALARPGTGVAVALPLLLLLAGRPRGVLRLGPAAAVAALPAVLCFAWINLRTTGDALEPAYVRYASEVSPDDGWGLANLATAPTSLFLNGARLGTWLHGFGLSAALAWIGLAVWGGRRRGLLCGVPLALAAFYALLTFHGVPWAGPLYWVEGFPLLVVLSSEGLHVLGARVGRRVPRVLLGAAVVGAALLIARREPLAGQELALRDAHRAAAASYRSRTGYDGELLIEVPLVAGLEVKRRFLAPPAELGTDAWPPRSLFVVGGGDR
ncbi:MAG: phospholipid carrier-dependent glycosyltransferase, partial [Planctomycetota bacterium]